MQRPIDVATQATVRFVASNLFPGASVLEVGCGRGDVAVELIGRGHVVRGIESDPEAALQARSKGVHVVGTAWPAYDGGDVDAVVFTRSLHHIHDLSAAITRARDLLRPGGRLIVEDFAFDSIDSRTVAWFRSTVTRRRHAFDVAAAGDSLAAKILSADDPLAAWHRDHDHDLHSIDSMASAIEREFGIIAQTDAPYLYRYLIPALPESRRAAAIVDDVLQQELHSAEAGDIRLIGRRIVAATARNPEEPARA